MHRDDDREEKGDDRLSEQRLTAHLGIGGVLRGENGKLLHFRCKVFVSVRC